MPRSLSLPVVLIAVFLAGCASGPVALHDGTVPQAAVATLLLPEQLEVALINGVEVEGASGMMTRGDKTLELAPGRYEIVVFYRELWEIGDEHDILRSDPALFVLEATAGGRYRMDYERPGGIESARELAADFGGWIENLASGQRVPSQASGLQFRRGLVSALTFDDTLVPTAQVGGGQAVEPLPQADGEVAAPAGVVVVGATAPAGTPSGLAVTPAPEAAATAMPDGSWLDLMKSFWSEASSEERRDFLRWLAEQR
jgi:uncharacterized protein YccT (UPF0319 family)